MATLQFLGAAGTVTGSCYLLEHRGQRVLIDCGLFQGPKALRSRNREALPVDPRGLAAVVLTHAHIDHTGGLPRLFRQGYRGPVYCTPATRDLCGLLLPDSAYLHEEEARDANERGYSKHSPALPLYTVRDARLALEGFESFGYERTRRIAPGIRLTFYRSGHILGAAVCVIDLEPTGERIIFSGDLGRYGAPILRDPQPVPGGTTVLIECTYGDREHEERARRDTLETALNEAFERKGVVVIPSFAIGRAQELLYHLDRLEETGRIPEVDVFVDSPMAVDATPIFLAHPEEHDLVMRSLVEQNRSPLSTRRTRFISSVAESRRLNAHEGPAVIISASGMATGGRVLHHLAHRLPDPRNTVLFVGYQAAGTRGRRLVDGEKEIRIHGRMVPVRATVKTLAGFSAHADATEAMRWLDGHDTPPQQIFCVHGEERALQAMQRRLIGRGLRAYIPSHLETVALATPPQAPGQASG
ncbi:MAG TPA: MBL fold metallo-hydrolase [Myxococcaceae bacterium]|nr:MBL fold metallo-hydrolase [Myxococcaceae bacterium]